MLRKPDSCDALYLNDIYVYKLYLLQNNGRQVAHDGCEKHSMALMQWKTPTAKQRTKFYEYVNASFSLNGQK